MKWAAPIAFVAEKDKTLRFCVDHRKVKAVTNRDSSSMPSVDGRRESHGKATFFYTLNANSGYWQIGMEDVDEEKTAFTFYQRLYRFVHMQFGLCNVPSTFQHTIDVIMSSTKWKFAIACPNNIIVFSKTPQQHIDHE